MGLVISKGLTLKSYNTPAAIAGVAPTLDYRFALDRREIEAISLTDRLTYTGATNGTFVNRSGLIERATTDQPRFDHGPASRQSLGLLVEESRENLLLRSEEFDNSYWAKIRASVVPNVITAPDGTLTADKLVEDTQVGPHHVNRVSFSFTNGVSYTLSGYYKAAERTRIIVQLGNNGAPFPSGGAHAGSFDLATGLVIAAGTSLTSATITPVGDGWYRCSVTATAQATATDTIFAAFLVESGDTSSYAGDGTSGIYIWGAQLEVGAFPTSYIPTTTTALTRPVDSAVIDGTGVITGTYTLVEQPAGCAVVNGTNIDLVSGFTAERVMVFPAALSAPQITAIRGAM
jgi:hypothetical protein